MMQQDTSTERKLESGYEVELELPLDGYCDNNWLRGKF